MITLHGFFAEAAATGEVALAELTGRAVEVSVEEVRATALADFADRGLLLSQDLIAGVIGRIEGMLPGVMTLVLEPEDALAWARQKDGTDPVAGFVTLGSVWQAGVARALGALLEGEVTFVGGRLAETDEPAMLVGTHAPSDTVVFSSRLRIESRDEALPAVSHLLVEPKYFARVLMALSAASH
jgi:hypothetical protein